MCIRDRYKAFWFSFYDYDSYRAKYKKRTAANFRTYFTGVVKKGKSLGMNRVSVQVRPFGDAIYKSNPGFLPCFPEIYLDQGKYFDL